MTQQRFEANTLAEVLAKIQREVGPEAKIASAQRIRSGGAFGFFQRERFEVMVDMPEPRAPERPGIEETSTADWLMELAQSVNDEERRIEDPIVSTESSAFADVLSRVAYQADMPESTPAPKFTPEPVDVEPVMPEATVRFEEPEPETVSVDPTPIEPEPQPEPEPIPTPEPAPQPVPSAEIRVNELPVSAPVVRPAPVVREVQTAVPAMRTRATDHPLAKLGLPAAYIPAGQDVIDLRSTLTRALTERLPKTPVIKPSRGSIIAIVGIKDDAVRIAEDIAVEFGRPKEEVMLATQHIKGTTTNNIVNSIQNAEDMQRSWSRRRRPTIIAIDAALGSRDTAWAEHVLTALEPIATFGVVDATRKSEDVSAWADALGGIDCLALNKIEETVSPAAVLQSGIPVERIDGRKATPEYWSLLLTERLPAA